MSEDTDAERRYIEELQALNAKLRTVNDELKREVAERVQAEALLQKRNAELQKLNAIMMDREERILELKREINALLLAFGRAPKYQA